MLRVQLVGHLGVKHLMRSVLIVERQVALRALLGRIDGLVRGQIDLLVCNVFPQSLDEHVVSPAAFPLHADLDAVVGQQLRAFLASELVSLVRIADSGNAIAGDGICIASRQKSVVSELESRYANIRRLAQSRTARDT
jgi:hypothetical protein